MERVICCQQGTLVNYDDKRFFIGGGRGIFFYIVNFINFQVEPKIYGKHDENKDVFIMFIKMYIILKLLKKMLMKNIFIALYKLGTIYLLVVLMIMLSKFENIMKKHLINITSINIRNIDNRKKMS